MLQLPLTGQRKKIRSNKKMITACEHVLTASDWAEEMRITSGNSVSWEL